VGATVLDKRRMSRTCVRPRVVYILIKIFFPKNIAIPFFVELLILVAQMKALVEQSSTKLFPKFKSENFLSYANFKNLLNLLELKNVT